MSFMISLLGVMGPVLSMILGAIGVSDDKKRALLKSIEDWQNKYRGVPVEISDEEKKAEDKLAERIKKP
jgi:hypothetical protein